MPEPLVGVQNDPTFECGPEMRSFLLQENMIIPINYCRRVNPISESVCLLVWGASVQVHAAIYVWVTDHIIHMAARGLNCPYNSDLTQAHVIQRSVAYFLGPPQGRSLSRYHNVG